MSCPNLAYQGILDEIGAILTDRVADHSIPPSSTKTRRRLALEQWTLTWSAELLSTFQRKTRFTRKAHGHAAQYAQTGQSVHSSVYCVQWNFWTKFGLSELFEAYLLLKDRTNAERGAPGSGTPIGRAGPRAGGGSQVKIMCWQVSTDTPPGTREARVREWAERSLENASWLPIDCVGVDDERLWSGWKEVRGRWEWL